MSRPKPIFIGGYMHSETSLLFELIANSKHIFAGLKETKILEYPSKYVGSSSEKILHSILGNSNSMDFGDKTVITKQNFYKSYFETYEYLAERKNNNYYLDGSPNQYLQFKNVIKHRQESKFIFIKRDPRDVISSLKKRKTTTNIERYKSEKVLKKKKLEKKYYLFIHAFSIKMTCRKFKNLAKENPQNVYMIDYADLTQNTDHVLKNISSFIGLDAPIPVKENVAVNNSADVNAKSGEITLRSSYKENLTRNEARFIESYFAKLYEFDGLNHRSNSLKGNIEYTLFLFKELSKSGIGIIDFIFSRILLLRSPSVFFDWVVMRLRRLF